MLTIFIRAIVLFTVLLIVMRLMGKRQIGEMEPYELAITLVIAELACIPMSDKSIPLAYGIVSMLSLYVVHQIILLLGKNNVLQNVISGKASIVIDNRGINYQALKQMNMQTSDLLQSMRVEGYFSIEEIKFALFETNGRLSVIPQQALQNTQKNLPVPVILDGKISKDDIKNHTINTESILNELKKMNYKIKNLLLVTIDSDQRLFIQPKGQRFIVKNLSYKVMQND